MSRGRDSDLGAAVPLELDSQPYLGAEFPEAATSRQPSFLDQGAEYSLRPGMYREGLAETGVLVPAPRPGRWKPAGCARGAPDPSKQRAATAGRLQCATLPDRDQHHSTLRAPQAAEAQSHPPSSPSPALAARKRGGSDPLRVPVTRRTVTKKLTDSQQPWQDAVVSTPSPSGEQKRL